MTKEKAIASNIDALIIFFKNQPNSFYLIPYKEEEDYSTTWGSNVWSSGSYTVKTHRITKKDLDAYYFKGDFQ